MRIAALLTIFAASAFALPSEQAPSDAAPIINAFKEINGKLQSFDKQIQAVTASSPAEATAKTLRTAGDEIIKALTDGVKIVAATTPVQLLEAVPLGTQANELGKNADTVITHLIEKKDIIVKANQTALVKATLEKQKTVTTEFSKTVASKLPKMIESAALTAGQKAATSIDRGIAAFS
jgi:hypothetical protein